MFSLFTALKIKTASMRAGKCLIISVYRKKKFSGLVWFHLSTRTIKLFFCLTIQTEHHKCLLLLALNKKAAGFCFDCISRRFYFAAIALKTRSCKSTSLGRYSDERQSFVSRREVKYIWVYFSHEAVLYQTVSKSGLTMTPNFIVNEGIPNRYTYINTSY